MGIINFTTASATPQTLLPAGNYTNVLFQSVAGGQGWLNFGNSPTFTPGQVNTTTGVITTTVAHDLNFGQAVTLGSATSPPGNLNNVATYFILPLSPTTFYFCSSYANLLAGTPIIPNTGGVGTQTVIISASPGIGILFNTNANLFFNANEYPDICGKWTIYTAAATQVNVLYTAQSTPANPSLSGG